MVLYSEYCTPNVVPPIKLAQRHRRHDVQLVGRWGVWKTSILDYFVRSRSLVIQNFTDITDCSTRSATTITPRDRRGVTSVRSLSFSLDWGFGYRGYFRISVTKYAEAKTRPQWLWPNLKIRTPGKATFMSLNDVVANACITSYGSCGRILSTSHVCTFVRTLSCIQLLTTETYLEELNTNDLLRSLISETGSKQYRIHLPQLYEPSIAD